MDNVCNRRLFSFPAKVEMAEEQEYLESRFTAAGPCFGIVGGVVGWL